MDCNEAEMLIEAYADGELDNAQRRSIEQHLCRCPACAAKHHDLLTLRARLRAEVPRYTAPATLRQRVNALLVDTPDAAPARPQTARDRWRWLSAGALAGCTATILVWVLGSAIIDNRNSEDIAVEAVAIHVRATLSEHLIEVASSDQHTVKPWLSARLDYSPPVRDMANEGFALIGGRIDTLHGQQVATLVYRYRLHTIDIFVRPGLAHALSAPRSLRGFNVEHASGSGMDWLAVSDVSPDVLSAFVQQLARNDQPQ